MLTEDEVVDHVVFYLKRLNYRIGRTCKGTARGDDISATSNSGIELYIECKGSVSRHGNSLDAWRNSAFAVFGAIMDSEFKRPKFHHAIAFPNTTEYRKLIGVLNDFLREQKITIFWVASNGLVSTEGADLP